MTEARTSKPKIPDDTKPSKAMLLNMTMDWKFHSTSSSTLKTLPEALEKVSPGSPTRGRFIVGQLQKHKI